MPIILITTGAGRTRNLLSIANSVLRCAGQPSITTIPASVVEPEDEMTFLVLDALDEVQQELFEVCREELARAEWKELLDPANTRYTIQSGLMKMLADPRVAERQLALMQQDEIFRLDPEFTEPPSNTITDGAPTSYAIDGDSLIIHPRPSPRYLLDKYVYEDAGWWACAKPHVAGAPFGSPTTPGGHSGEIWVQVAPSVGIDPAGDDYATSDFVWVEGKRYTNAYITTPYSAGPTLLRNTNDTPTLPYWYYPALIAGACWRVKAELNFDQNKIDEQGGRYMALRGTRIASRSRAKKNPRLRYEVEL
jgi:hypothetical protein